MPSHASAGTSKPQVDPTLYYRRGYDHKKRFISYWHQIDEIAQLEQDSVLEIGVGNKFVSTYLQTRGFSVTSMDIDPRLQPSCVGSVLHLPFPNSHFDVVACFEVLEHLPFETFSTALSELHRVSNAFVVISLPDYTRAYQFILQLPKIGKFQTLFPLPRLRAPIHRFDGEHWWEIGKRGYSLSTILGQIEDAGFRLRRTFRVFEHPYHRFFSLVKVDDPALDTQAR